MGYPEPIKKGPNAGRFRAIYRDPFDPDHGKIRLKGVTFPTKDVAKAAADREEQRLRDIAAGMDVDLRPARDDAPTLLDYGLSVIEDTPEDWWSRATRHSYLNTVRFLVANYFGEDFRVSKLDVHAAERCYGWLARSDRGFQRRSECMTVLRHIVNRARRDGYKELDDPGTWQIRIRRDPKRRQKMVTEDELSRLAQHMPGHMVPALYLAHDSGLRRSEIAGLKVSSVDLERGFVQATDILEFDNTERDYDKGRTGSDEEDYGDDRVWPGSGWVPMSHRAWELMRAHLAIHGGNPHGRAFLKPHNNQPVTIGHVGLCIRKARESAGLSDKITWHALRRSFATRLGKSGADRGLIKIYMRHENEKTTEGYIQEFDQERGAGFIRREFGGPSDSSGS
jgi:integrase